MIVVISPSKTFSNKIKIGSQEPIFINKAKVLRRELKTKSIDQLINEFKLSNSLAKTVYNFYHSINNEVAAIDLYEGILFKALKTSELNFIDNNLYIVSALYGLLRPNDTIQKYRLDFTIKSLGNLYNYWTKDICNYLINNYQNEIIIDLTSKEFSQLLKGVNNVVTIEFTGKNNKRLSSVLLKQLRGYLANIIINSNIKTLNELKAITVDNFSYDKQLSNSNTYYFSTNTN